MNISTILLITKILDLVLLGAQISVELRREAQELNNKVKRYVELGTEPTPAELAEIEARIEAKISALQDLVDDE